MTPNPQQQLVVEHFDGPCMVMAVPGSGKTASVTERTKRLIQRGVDPRNILAITFTNKAANEMRTRIARAVGDKASQMTISTFHSLCSRLIRANCEYLGLSKDYSIYDMDESERLLKKCIVQVESPIAEGFSPSKKYMQTLMGFIDGKRTRCLSDEEAMDRFGIDGNQAKVAAAYFDAMRKANALDFTGLISETLRLFSENDAVREKYRKRFIYISVDEVQDTNIAQYELVKHLGYGHKNVLIVGDYQQSIFGFQGAYPENIMAFERDFAPCKVLKLEKNYRSTPSILGHSQNLIEHNAGVRTLLQTDNPDGQPPRIIGTGTDLEMADRIARDLQSRLSAGTIGNECVVLYRTNYASRVLEGALKNLRIRYRVIGGTSFWDRKEVKNCLALLKLMANRNDVMAFEVACEACCKGVGEKSLSVISDISKDDGSGILAAARKFSAGGSQAGKAISPFLDAFEKACSSPLPGQALIDIAKETAMWKRLEDDSTQTNDRCGNVLEMARDVDDYVSVNGNSLSGYLQNILLATDADESEDDKDVVRLMTLHRCKGLEFDAVFISHCNEGMIPHGRLALEATDKDEYERAVEEERRLLYVGMTRARKFLSLYYSRSKVDARSRKPVATPHSRFLPETGIFVPEHED